MTNVYRTPTTRFLGVLAITLTLGLSAAAVCPADESLRKRQSFWIVQPVHRGIHIVPGTRLRLLVRWGRVRVTLSLVA